LILYRCFPWDRDVGPAARGGALWFPRIAQGYGRHDNPLLYGCLYVTERAVSAVVEQLARFTGTSLNARDLRHAGRPLALASLDLASDSQLVDLDEPSTLAAEALRPSLVATYDRGRTQADAAALFERHAGAAGIRWWSTFESQWPNVTLFDRAQPRLAVAAVAPLTPEADLVGEAAEFLGLAIQW
jgi:hypothetical protein